MPPLPERSLSVWFVPTITATSAAGMNQLKPVSGNWCWISGKRTDLRYALGHGWRFSIIFVTIGIYIYIWIYMRHHFTQLNITTNGSTYNHASTTAKRREFRRDDAFELRSESQTELHEINVEYRFEVKHSDGRSATSVGKEEVEPTVVELGLHNGDGGDKSPSVTSAEDPYTKPTSVFYSPSETKPKLSSSQAGSGAMVESTGAQKSQNPQHQRRQSRHVEKEIKKMLLLNAYPVLYVILWLPGIINRLVEAAGHTSKTLAILQCSTQYVGFANAITYGFNEHLRERVRGDLTSWFEGRRS